MGVQQQGKQVVNRPPQWSGNNNESALAEIRQAIDQLWQKTTELGAQLSALLEAIGATISFKQLVKGISDKNGHTSKMPDDRNENGDHDARYLKRSVFASLFNDHRHHELYDSGLANVKVSVDAAGNVGIGTITPQGKMHIVGDTQLCKNIGPDSTDFTRDSTVYPPVELCDSGILVGKGSLTIVNNSGIVDLKYTGFGYISVRIGAGLPRSVLFTLLNGIIEFYETRGDCFSLSESVSNKICIYGYENNNLNLLKITNGFTEDININYHLILFRNPNTIISKSYWPGDDSLEDVIGENDAIRTVDSSGDPLPEPPVEPYKPGYRNDGFYFGEQYSLRIPNLNNYKIVENGSLEITFFLLLSENNWFKAFLRQINSTTNDIFIEITPSLITIGRWNCTPQLYTVSFNVLFNHFTKVKLCYSAVSGGGKWDIYLDGVKLTPDGGTYMAPADALVSDTDGYGIDIEPQGINEEQDEGIIVDEIHINPEKTADFKWRTHGEETYTNDALWIASGFVVDLKANETLTGYSTIFEVYNHNTALWDSLGTSTELLSIDLDDSDWYTGDGIQYYLIRQTITKGSFVNIEQRALAFMPPP